MTNTLAVVLACLIAAAIALDVTLNAGAASVFLGRKTLDLIQWIAFWR